MSLSISSNISSFDKRQIIEYCEHYCRRFRDLVDESVKEKNTFISTFLSYLLPVQRILNTYRKGQKAIYIQTLDNFSETLWSILEGNRVNSDEIFNMGIVTEHVTTYWYAADEAITNPKTNEMDFLYDHYQDCEKYFPNFESEYNDFEKLLCDCIGMTLYDISYWLEHNCNDGYYGLFQMLHFLCQHLEGAVRYDILQLEDDNDKSSLRCYTHHIFQRELKLLQEDINNALSAETLDDIVKLKTAYRVKSYFPENNLGFSFINKSTDMTFTLTIHNEKYSDNNI